MKPLVSIIMPFYNAGAFMKQSLDKVLMQDHENLQIICINDGSSDDTGSILSLYAKKDNRILLIENERNLGLIATLNKALTYVKGEFFARMDADDDMEIDRISRQVEYLVRNPDIQIVSSGYHYMDQNGKMLHYLPPVATSSGAIKYLSIFVTAITHAAICARTSLITSKIYMYDPAFRHSEDFELFSRLTWSNIKLGSISSSLYKVRLHSQSVSALYRSEQIDTNVNILKRNLSSYANFTKTWDDDVLKVALCIIDRTLQVLQVRAGFNLLDAIQTSAYSDEMLSANDKDQVRNFINIHKSNIIVQANKFNFRNKCKGRFAFFLRSLFMLSPLQFVTIAKKIFR